jgi:TRAP-type C4-dicarboxylate transport system substrate-binding protein
MFAEQEDKLLEELKAKGMEVNTLTPEQKALFVEATRPVYDQFKDQLGEEIVEIAKKVK